MGILDRFRRQPAWKHADAATRVAAVEALPLDEQELLTSIAREDADARVRSAAVKKIYDMTVVADLAGRDADAGVREQAATLLVELALGAFEGTSEEESLRALELIPDEKGRVAVAKEAASERVARAALARVADLHALGSIARRAGHGSVRLEALGRVEDRAELRLIAVRTEFKDVALAAIDRVPDRETLETVVAKGKSKAAVRRARGLLRDLELAGRAAEAAAQPPAAPVAPPAPDPLAPWVELCERVEALDANRADAVAEVAAAEGRWEAMGEPADPAVAARFRSACERMRETLRRLDAEESEARRRQQETAAHVSERAARCEVVESLLHLFDTLPVRPGDEPGDEPVQARVNEALAQLEEIRREWATLEPLPEGSPAGEAVVQRFERAARDLERRHAAWIAARRRWAALDRLAGEMERLPDEASPDVKARWSGLKRAWTAEGGDGPVDETLRSRMEAVAARVTARENEAREKRLREQQDQLARLQRTCAQVEALAAQPDGLALKDGERALRDVRGALDEVSALPPSMRRERDELAGRLTALQDALVPKVRELREADDWQRWANAGVQEEICRRVEALAGVEDAAEVARVLREAQEQWKKVAQAPRDKAQALWLRFKAAQDQVRPRVDALFEEQARERGANLERKQALCERAEALSGSTDWIKTAEEIKKLQAEWKTIGPVPRGQEKALWERFRAACDQFFTRRRDDLLKRKDEWAANLARKQALIAEVDALAGTTDWDKAIEEIKRIQVEWRAVGPVRKKHADDVWEQFRSACDRFAERYQQRDQVQMSANQQEREAVCEAIEAIAAGDGAEDAAPLVEQVRALRQRWERAGVVPQAQLAALSARFAAALAAVAARRADDLRGTEFDAEANRRKLEELCARIEALAGPQSEREALPDESPAVILAARLREALAANTIGGPAVVDEEARRRTAMHAVKEAQAAWRRVGPLAPEVQQGLEARFQAACRLVLEGSRPRR